MKNRLSTVELNPQQQSAIEPVGGPVMILAGPGSGKTRVITHRIARLIQAGIPSWNIVALTFTNKAAAEMKNRLATVVPDNQVWSSTFHRFCSRLLRQHANLVGLGENFSIFDAGDARKVVKQAIVNLNVDIKNYSPDRLANEISRVKNAGVTVEGFAPRPGHYLDTVIAKVYPEYQNLLRISNAVDFDDLLLTAVDLLRRAPDLRQILDQRYEFMLVDEYQDTNVAQYQLIRMLSYDHPNLTVTGDPDQSIYGWRGANLRNILDFEKDYPDVQVFRLEQNYRSTKSILAVADQLILNNVRRKHKTLFTENQQGKPVRLVAFRTPEDEAAEIADAIALAVERGGRGYNDFAILYRTNYLSRVLEHAFRRRSVPYQILRGYEFYQRKEVKDILAFLQLMNNPADSVALERIINVPPRSIGQVSFKRLQQFAFQQRLPMLEAARQVDQVSTLTNAPRAKIKKFVAIMDQLAQWIEHDVPTIIEQVLQETGYRDWLLMDTSEEGTERAANVDELINAAIEFERDHQGEGGLERYLEQAALISDTDAMKDGKEFVTMMSLHAAKGLEYPVVYVIGLEEGILPHERSAVDNEQVEEERRLLFVGITRAMDELQLSRCLNRFRRGDHWPCIASRFLMELPRNEMEIFEPSTGRYDYDCGNSEISVAGLDPFMNDGLPSLDIHADRYEVHGSIGIDNDQAISDSHDDSVGEAVLPYQVVASTIPTLPPKSRKQASEIAPIRLRQGEQPGLLGGSISRSSIGGRPASRAALANIPHLKIASEIEHEQDESEFRLYHPQRFQIGMQVEHAEYGSGRVVNLAGEGKRVMGTIEFKEYGKKRFHLSFTPLRIVE